MKFLTMVEHLFRKGAFLKALVRGMWPLVLLMEYNPLTYFLP
jgi:hypothetical protein